MLSQNVLLKIQCFNFLPRRGYVSVWAKASNSKKGQGKLLYFLLKKCSFYGADLAPKANSFVTFFCSFPLCISDTHIFFTNCVYSTLVHLAITCILCTLFVVMISNIIKLCYTITPKWSVSIKARIEHNRSSVQPQLSPFLYASVSCLLQVIASIA